MERPCESQSESSIRPVMSVGGLVAQMSDWMGRTDSTEETISANPLCMMDALLDNPTTSYSEGSQVPPLWHWLFFLPSARTAELGPDGHPKRGDFYPAIPLRRRMFGASDVTIHRPLLVGARVRRVREVVSVHERSGRSGPLVLVGVRHSIECDESLAITEFQTIVYTDAKPASIPNVVEPPEFEWREFEWREERSFDSVDLFRFSALTFNSHRIHYDSGYSRHVEGYPDIVVQGPLMALVLSELARAHGADVRSFSFRAHSPAFASEPLTLGGRRTAGGAQLAAYRGKDLIMTASAKEIEDTMEPSHGNST